MTWGFMKLIALKTQGPLAEEAADHIGDEGAWIFPGPGTWNISQDLGTVAATAPLEAWGDSDTGGG